MTMKSSMKPMKLLRTLTAAVAGSALLLGLAGCGTDPTASGSSASASASTKDSGAQTITVGSANFAESQILGEIYARALNANGVKAVTKPNIGSREVYVRSLQDGSIDLIPDYSGNLLQYFNPKATEASAEAVSKALEEKTPKGLKVLDESSAEDADVLVTTAETARKIKDASLANLAEAFPQGVKIAAPPEFGTRAYGIPGLKRVYGVSATLVPISDEGGQATVTALDKGQVQIAKLTTTSPYLRGGKYVALKDPKHMIAAQNVVPLASSRIAGDKKAVAVIDAVQKKLTTDDLISMNAQSINDKKPAAAIARQWLAKHPVKVSASR